MTEKRTTARAFHDAVGMEDWRVLFSGAHAYFRVRSFADAVRFVAAIAEAAEAVDHFPDVDLRPEGVTVRTASGEYGALSERDIELARRVSAAAHTLHLEADPSQVQVVGIAVAQNAGSDVAPFWAAALGYKSPSGPMRTWSIGTDATRTYRSSSSSRLSRAAAAPTSTSACPPTRRGKGRCGTRSRRTVGR